MSVCPEWSDHTQELINQRYTKINSWYLVTTGLWTTIADEANRISILMETKKKTNIRTDELRNWLWCNEKEHNVKTLL